MYLHCPMKNGQGCCSVLVCVFRCPPRKKLKCGEYEKYYTELVVFGAKEEHVARYGAPILPLPYKLRPKRRRKAA